MKRRYLDENPSRVSISKPAVTPNCKPTDIKDGRNWWASPKRLKLSVPFSFFPTQQAERHTSEPSQDGKEVTIQKTQGEIKHLKGTNRIELKTPCLQKISMQTEWSTADKRKTTKVVNLEETNSPARNHHELRSIDSPASQKSSWKSNFSATLNSGSNFGSELPGSALQQRTLFELNAKLNTKSEHIDRTLRKILIAKKHIEADLDIQAKQHKVELTKLQTKLQNSKTTRRALRHEKSKIEKEVSNLRTVLQAEKSRNQELQREIQTEKEYSSKFNAMAQNYAQELKDTAYRHSKCYEELMSGKNQLVESNDYLQTERKVKNEQVERLSSQTESFNQNITYLKCVKHEFAAALLKTNERMTDINRNKELLEKVFFDFDTTQNQPLKQEPTSCNNTTEVDSCAKCENSSAVHSIKTSDQHSSTDDLRKQLKQALFERDQHLQNFAELERRMNLNSNIELKPSIGLENIMRIEGGAILKTFPKVECKTNWGNLSDLDGSASLENQFQPRSYSNKECELTARSGDGLAKFLLEEIPKNDSQTFLPVTKNSLDEKREYDKSSLQNSRTHNDVDLICID